MIYYVCKIKTYRKKDGEMERTELLVKMAEEVMERAERTRFMSEADIMFLKEMEVMK